MDLGCLDCSGWREGKLWSRVQRFSHWPSSKADDCILVELQEAQIGIRATHLHTEPLLYVFGFGDSKPALAGTELHENQLVIFAALQLERSTVGAVRNDRVPYI